MANRVQAPRLADPEGLQTPGAINTPALQAPGPAVGKGGLEQLADALGSFHSGVSKFGSAYAYAQRVHKDKTQEQELEFLKAVNTPEAFKSKVDSGEIPPFADPYVQHKNEITYGQFTADALAKDVQAKIAAGELSPSDAPAYVEKHRQQIFEDQAFKGNVGRLTGYGAAWNSINEWAQKQAVNAWAKGQEDNRLSAASQTTSMFMDQLYAKVSPQEAWAHVNDLKRDLVSRHFTPKEADQFIMRDIARRVEQDPNWAVAFAKARREDTTQPGVVLPSLAEHPDFASEVASWEKTAARLNAAEAKANTEKGVSDQDVKALLSNDGSWERITDFTYTNPVTGAADNISREKRMSDAISRVTTQSALLARQNNETPQQTFNREAQIFVDNNVKHPVWKSQIEGALMGVSDRGMVDPATSTKIRDGYHRYVALQDRSPAYVREHISTRAQNFYQTAQMLQESMTNPDGSRMTEEQALMAARGALDMDRPDRQQEFTDQRNTIKTYIGTIANPHSVFATYLPRFLGFDTANAKNVGAVRAAMIDLSTALVMTGRLDGETAVKVATEHLAKTSEVKNGIWMRKSSDAGFDYGQVSSRIITDYLKSDAGRAMGYGAGDISVVEHKGFYTLVDGNFQPIHGGSMLSRQDMMDVQRRINDERNAEIIRNQNAEAELRRAAEEAKRRDPTLVYDREGNFLPLATGAKKLFKPMLDQANDAAHAAVKAGQIGTDNPIGASIEDVYRKRKRGKN